MALSPPKVYFLYFIIKELIIIALQLGLPYTLLVCVTFEYEAYGLMSTSNDRVDKIFNGDFMYY